MTPEQRELLERLDALDKAATPGPWRDTWERVAEGELEEQIAISCDLPELGGAVVGLLYYDGLNTAIRKEDAALIVALRNATPAIRAALARLDAAERVVEYARKQEEHCECVCDACVALTAAIAFYDATSGAGRKP